MLSGPKADCHSGYAGKVTTRGDDDAAPAGPLTLSWALDAAAT